MLDRLRWECTPFRELAPGTLYAILALRNEVFVVEQDCVYNDTDGRDVEALHLQAWDGDELVAHARLLPPGVYVPDVTSIGRIVVRRAARGTGTGRAVVDRAIEVLRNTWPTTPIRIAAQQYLLRFYATFGFEPIGEGYIEDGIPHHDMLLVN